MSLLWRVRVGMLVVLATFALPVFVAVSPADEPAGGSHDQDISPREARKKNPIPADQGSIMTGKQLFGGYCQACHGAGGKGDGPVAHLLIKRPADLTSPAVAQQTDGTIFWKITRGHRPMPTFETALPEEARWNIVNYQRTLAPRPATQP